MTTAGRRRAVLHIDDGLVGAAIGERETVPLLDLEQDGTS